MVDEKGTRRIIMMETRDRGLRGSKLGDKLESHLSADHAWLTR